MDPNKKFLPSLVKHDSQRLPSQSCACWGREREGEREREREDLGLALGNEEQLCIGTYRLLMVPHIWRGSAQVRGAKSLQKSRGCMEETK